MGEIQNINKPTPIEIVLGIGEDGKTTAKNLYEFLEMDKTHYSRWVKSNITENPFAEENVDYWALAIDGERNFNPNPTQDFKLSANFAKKLSMQGKTERAEQAREYFIKVEDKLKEVVQNGMSHNVEQLTITSRDMARMIGKIHGTTLTIIRDCIKELTDMGFNTTEFFQQSTYHGGNNQEILQYLCTERGCDYFSGHLEPDIRKMFVADFKGRFERMQNVVDGKPVNDVTNKNLIGMADMPEQEPVIRLFESNTGSVLLIDNDVYGLMPEETETVRRLIPELEKNGVNQIKKVLIAILESGTKSGKLTEITSWRLENEETEPEKPDIPKKREEREDSVDLNNVETLSTEQAKLRYGLGYDAIQRAARECKAIVRMGNRRLYSRRKLDKYFESLASSV